MMKRFFGIVASLVLLSGCAVPLDAPRFIGTLILRPKVVDTYSAQALVNKYTKASINHLVIKLFKVVSGVEDAVPTTTCDVPSAKIDSTVSFANLKVSTNYRVRCYAYKAAGTAPADQISDDAQSFIDVTIATENAPTIANLKVKLIDVPFGAQATDSIVVTDGSYSDTGAETITVP